MAKAEFPAGPRRSRLRCLLLRGLAVLALGAGCGVPKNDAEALKWLRQAAQRGSVEARQWALQCRQRALQSCD
jgi:TPR repeat protein